MTPNIDPVSISLSLSCKSYTLALFGQHPNTATPPLSPTSKRLPLHLHPGTSGFFITQGISAQLQPPMEPPTSTSYQGVPVRHLHILAYPEQDNTSSSQGPGVDQQLILLATKMVVSLRKFALKQRRSAIARHLAARFSTKAYLISNPLVSFCVVFLRDGVYSKICYSQSY